jgi:hypothetical protein
MIRMLLVGYCMGIRSERRLCEEVHLIPLVLSPRPRWQGSRPFDLFKEPAWPLPRERHPAPSV